MNTDTLFKTFGIGFDNLFSHPWLSIDSYAKQTFPPHNIIRESDTVIRLELAVAGYTKEGLSISVSDGALKIQGGVDYDHNKDLSIEEYRKIIHRGIKSQPFHRSFQLADNVEVSESKLENGILTIYLNVIIPEEKKPKKIIIK